MLCALWQGGDDAMEDAASDAKREDGSLSNAGATGEEQETADDEKADDGRAGRGGGSKF